ncbi:MAG: MBL fold metallo-hydrolase [Actinobacteria bacterium]|nr:MBL fold metallo-hydrolase [Actinomycetota bacterium]
MIFKQLQSGGDRNYAYIIASQDTRECAVVDPSPDPSAVIKAVREEGLKVKYLINTHLHFDHSGGNDYFLKINSNFNAASIVPVNCSSNTRVADGTILNLGELKLEIIHTPGHTMDSICVKVQDKLITGDTLFVGKVGGTYSEHEAIAEFESLKKIMKLAPGTGVWPGHDYGVSPSSTIGAELEGNPFIKRLSDFNEFLLLKRNWAQYKKEHGIK